MFNLLLSLNLFYDKYNTLLISIMLYCFVCREQQDSAYEAASMAINVGLWYTKHAAKLAAKEE